MNEDLYGTDIQLTNDGDIQAAPGGDLSLVTGLDNLNQAVVNRVLTQPDEYLFGDYGCTIKQYVDSVDPTLRVQIPPDVTASLLEDSRISDVSVNVTQDSSGDTTVQINYASAFGDTSSVEVTP